MPSKSVDRTMLSRVMATERSARLNGHTGEGSAEERMGQLYRSFTSQNKGLPALEFRPKVLADFVNARPAAKLTTQSSPYGKPNNPLACEVPETAKLTAKATEAPAPPAPLPGKRAALPTHSEKDAWDKATIASLCSAYEKSGKKLPDGEPPQTAQKLEKLCSDKRLKK